MVAALFTLTLFHHHTTNVLRPIFRDHPGEPVPEENFWTLWCKVRFTEEDTPTIWLGATPSRLTSAYLHHPPNIIPPWEDYSRGDIFRRRRPALASPRCRHYRAKYDTIAACGSHGARPETHHTAPRTVSLSIRHRTMPCIRTNGTEKI